jgi:hypothetical protein
MNKNTMKTSELTGAALDWAVAKCGGGGNFPESFKNAHAIGRSNYSTNWAQGGPIIEREGIGMGFGVGIDSDQWEAGYATPEETGPTPLIAAMRCYVASKLGDEIEIPKELK